MVKRHCDPITMDHIIELRKKLVETEKQRDNALAMCNKLYNELWELRLRVLDRKPISEQDEERNC